MQDCYLSLTLCISLRDYRHVLSATGSNQQVALRALRHSHPKLFTAAFVSRRQCSRTLSSTRPLVSISIQTQCEYCTQRQSTRTRTRTNTNHRSQRPSRTRRRRNRNRIRDRTRTRVSTCTSSGRRRRRRSYAAPRPPLSTLEPAPGRSALVVFVAAVRSRLYRPFPRDSASRCARTRSARQAAPAAAAMAVGCRVCRRSRGSSASGPTLSATASEDPNSADPNVNPNRKRCSSRAVRLQQRSRSSSRSSRTLNGRRDRRTHTRQSCSTRRPRRLALTIAIAIVTQPQLAMTGFRPFQSSWRLYLYLHLRPRTTRVRRLSVFVSADASAPLAAVNAKHWRGYRARVRSTNRAAPTSTRRARPRRRRRQLANL